MNPESRKDRALALLDQLRSDLENEQIADAMGQASALHQHLAEWQRSDIVQTARNWIEDALKADLITFDITTAQQYLDQWQEVALSEEGASTEVEHYRQQVEQRIQEKRDTLQIRGVISHCEALLQGAANTEAGAEPPHPEFMRRQYYDKALHTAQAAMAEFSDSPDLERLLQKVERVHNHKLIAAEIFMQALQHMNYTVALHNLDQLPATERIPRFIATTQTTGDVKFNYEGLVSQPEARSELTRHATTWASNTVQTAMQAAQQQLDAHNPQAGLDTLTIADDVRRYLDDDTRSQLNTLEAICRKTLMDQQTAQTRAEQAKKMAGDDPLAAWDTYTEARNTYEWAEGLTEARQAIIKGMRHRLRQLIGQVDEAFEARDMNLVRSLSQQARIAYENKDSALDELLQRVTEYGDMANRYDEYIQTGQGILAQVRELLWEDTVGANDLLSQVESYPDIVLEAFTDLYDLRTTVNQRLNADQRYSELYPALFDPKIDTVREAIDKANAATTEFAEDARFSSLLQALQLHLAYLSAQIQAQNGNSEPAQKLLAPVLSQPNHPDFAAAQQLMQQLQMPPEPPTPPAAEAEPGNDEPSPSE